MTNEKVHFEITVDNDELTKSLAQSRQGVVDSEKTAIEISSNLQAMVVDTTKAITDFNGALDVFGKKVIEVMATVAKGVDPKAELNSILKEYQSYADKRAAIEQKFNAKIEILKKNNANGQYDTQIKKTEKVKASELSKVNLEEMKEGPDFAQLFGKLDNLTIESMKSLRSKIKAVIDDGAKDLAPQELAAVEEKFKELNLKIADQKPFAGLKIYIEDVQKANKALIDAKKELSEAEKDSPASVTAKQKVIDAQKNKNDAIAVGQKAIKTTADDGKMAVGAANDIINMLGDVGIEVPGNIKDAVAGVGQMMEGLGSINISNPMSIITGGIKIIGGFVKSLTSIFSGDQKKEKDIQKWQKEIDALKVSYQQVGAAIDKAYSTDASKLIEQQDQMLRQQKVLIQNQISAEKSKKKADNGKIAAWEQELKTIDEALANNKERALDAIFGADLKSAIENFANAYADAWSKGEDRSKSSKDTVRKMMRDMVTESIKAAVQSSDAMQKIRQKLLEFYSDNKLSAAEQNSIYKMAEELQRELDRQFSWADSLMQDENSGKEREASARGIATASQESVDANNGFLTSIQGHTFQLNESMNVIKPCVANISESMTFIRDNAANQLMALYTIRDNTAPLADMKSEIGAMRADMNSIVLHGVKIR